MRIVIHGTGRMAEALVTAARGHAALEIIALVGPEKPSWICAIPWVSALDEIGVLPGLLIDFTLPAGTRAAAEWCAGEGVPLLSGVTGLDEAARAALRSAAKRVPVLWSPNLSLGVNMVAELAERVARALGPGVAVDIDDIHHQWKKDAPSGTALMLGERIAAARGSAESIEYHSERVGEVVGEHRLTFHMQGEELELIHRAHERSIFALGALDAGAWLVRQAPGFYSAQDWLDGRRG